MVLSWFSSRLNPIAVDIGTDTIKLLQIEPREGQNRLVAAACEVIPEEVRGKAVEREAFLGEAIKKMLNEGFRGKQVVTCLPAGHVAVQHLRMAKMTGEELTKALPFEAAGKLPFDPNRAVLRHTVAAEVYQNQEAKQEVILMGAPRDAVDRHLNVLSKAKLEVVGIHVEPTALLECFAHLFRRKGDEEANTLFIDMGAGSTHVVIAAGKNLGFAKHLPVGGDLLTRRVAEALKTDTVRARQVRIHVGQQQSRVVRLPAGLVAVGSGAAAHNGHAGNGQAGAPAADAVDAATVACVTAALADAVEALVADLKLCIHYFESIFPGRAVDRVIFVGGESRNLALCQQIAERLQLPALLGDPLARLVKDGVTQTNVDLRQPQPGWAIAVGLGLGVNPAAGEA